MNTIDNATASFNPMVNSADDIFELGLKYCLGQGVKQSLVEAHKWFNIAALKGSLSAKQYRCDIAVEMSADEIAEAQRQARAAITVH